MLLALMPFKSLFLQERLHLDILTFLSLLLICRVELIKQLLTVGFRDEIVLLPVELFFN